VRSEAESSSIQSNSKLERPSSSISRRDDRIVRAVRSSCPHIDRMDRSALGRCGRSLARE
jgi:hypothetical protein